MDIEEKDYEEYVRRIKQIDKILLEPIQSLVKLVVDGLKKGQGTQGFFKRSIEIPATILEDQEGLYTTPLNTALCCSTLQRIWLHRRRFPQLESELENLEKELAGGGRPLDSSVLELLAEPFLPAHPDKASFKDYVAIVANPDAGPCDPYTASQVFWTLFNSGEKNVHTATGFFAFFSMLWAMRRRLPEPGGVSAGNSHPSAYVTAKCMAPLFNLVKICRRRANLLDEIARLLVKLRKLMEQSDNPRRAQWLPLRLDELSGRLYELSSIAISRKGFQSCAREIGDIADQLNTRSNTAEPWARVIESLVRALRTLGSVGNQGLSEAARVVEKLLPALVEALEGKDPANALKELGITLKPPSFCSEKRRFNYWKDLATSAQEALDVCGTAFRSLQEVSRQSSDLPATPAKQLQKKEHRAKILDRLLGTPEAMGLLAALAKANRDVANEISDGMSEAEHWCEVVLTREIANASANHLTEFDPAELVSALFVAVTGHRIDSPLLINDAVEKARTGVRKDGSWIPGQPFFVDGDLGIWAPTSDIVLMLSSTIAPFQEVRAADEALSAYIDWLDRTRKRLPYQSQHPKGSGGEKLTISGWISERNFREKRIDLWATTFAINALLGIRELMEFRLWELCEKRFTVLSPSLKLSDIDAVDLGVSHAHRLHRRLARMARQAAGDEYKKAEYSLVLHGPPGSSKTAITEALAATWRSSLSGERRGARLIRITPADFTRKGEDRLDAEARLIFELLGRIRGVTILFDEIDDLLRMRDGAGEASFFKLVVPAMLNRLQDLRDACPQQEICFVLATNYVDRIEPALLRKGRIDKAVALVYPDRESRRCTLGKHVEKLRDETSKEKWREWAAFLLEKELGATERIAATDYWPWKTFDTLCREISGELNLVWRENLDDAARDERARQLIQRAITHGKAMVSTVVYESQRRERLRTSVELREEILQYSLAGAEDVAGLLDRLAAEPQTAQGTSWRAQDSNGRLLIRREAAAALRDILGEDLPGRLQEIAGMRGWSSVELGIAE